MPRPRKCRVISVTPVARYFKPQGVQLRRLGVAQLKDEELEALYLADMKDMDHESAAAQMQVSRSTFSRVLTQARKTVATALVEGAALKIEGGDFRLRAGKRLNKKEMEEAMPNRDQTGPLGTGPIGRGRGGCRTAADEAGMQGRGQGRRCGMGRGRGGGRGCAVTPRNETGALSREEEIASLENQLAAIQARLNVLK